MKLFRYKFFKLSYNFHNSRFPSRREVNRHLFGNDDPFRDLEKILRNFRPKENLRKRKNSEKSESPNKRRLTFDPREVEREMEVEREVETTEPRIVSCFPSVKVKLIKIPDVVSYCYPFDNLVEFVGQKMSLKCYNSFENYVTVSKKCP